MESWENSNIGQRSDNHQTAEPPCLHRIDLTFGGCRSTVRSNPDSEEENDLSCGLGRTD